MVTYHGRSYDQQVILHRCLLNGVSHPAWFQKAADTTAQHTVFLTDIILIFVTVFQTMVLQ